VAQDVAQGYLLAFYVSQSVVHAPALTDDCVELSLAIANRSAVFFHLRNYEVWNFSVTGN